MGDSVSTATPTTPAIPTTRLVWVEVRKMVDTLSGAWLLAIIALLTIGATVLIAFVGGQENLRFRDYLLTTGSPQALLLPVMGALLVTTEWTQRAALGTFTLVPRRGRIVVAKVLAAVLLGLAALVVSLVAAGVAALPRVGEGAFDEVGAGLLGGVTLMQLLTVLQGVAFGAFFLNSAAAIVSLFVLPSIVSVVTTLVPALQDSQVWVDLGTAQGPLTDVGVGAMSSGQWAHLATATLIWVVVPGAVGAWRMMTAEVK